MHISLSLYALMRLPITRLPLLLIPHYVKDLSFYQRVASIIWRDKTPQEADRGGGVINSPKGSNYHYKTTQFFWGTERIRCQRFHYTRHTIAPPTTSFQTSLYCVSHLMWASVLHRTCPEYKPNWYDKHALWVPCLVAHEHVKRVLDHFYTLYMLSECLVRRYVQWSTLHDGECKLFFGLVCRLSRFLV
jgi:hypothetical protein